MGKSVLLASSATDRTRRKQNFVKRAAKLRDGGVLSESVPTAATICLADRAGGRQNNTAKFAANRIGV